MCRKKPAKPSQASGSSSAACATLDELADPLVQDRDDERVLGREVAEDRAVADARAPGDLVDADVEAALGEALARDVEQAVEVALRVGAERHPPIGTTSACPRPPGSARRRGGGAARASSDEAGEHEARAAGEGPVEAVHERRLRAAGRAARRERAQDREPERTADLLRRVEEAGRETLIGVLEPRRRDERQRHEDGAEPERGEQDRRHDVGDVRPVHRDAREQHHAERGDDHPDDGDRPHADPRRELRRETGRDDDPGGERQERETGLQRAVAEHALEVERVEEEHREETRRDEEHRDVRRGQRPHAEDAEPDERRARAQLGDA